MAELFALLEKVSGVPALTRRLIEGALIMVSLADGQEARRGGLDRGH
jgi:hypothetical protein